MSAVFYILYASFACVEYVTNRLLGLVRFCLVLWYINPWRLFVDYLMPKPVYTYLSYYPVYGLNRTNSILMLN